MSQLRRIGYCLLALTLVFGLAAGFAVVSPRHSVRAQFGATTVPGYAASPATLAALSTTTGAGGTVTNPGANLQIQVDGGPIYCQGAEEAISESVVNLLANTTYLIVFNCPLSAVYAKKAVTAPGTPSPDQPGVPSTILAPVFGVEQSLAQVTCGVSTCATITDTRSLSQFPFARMMPSTTFANLPATYPNGAVLYCSTCTLPAAPATCVGAGTGSIAFRINGAWVCP